MANEGPRVVPLRAAVAMCAATAAVFFLGVLAAHAWPGRSGVETRSSFTVAGTVTLPPGETLRALTFRFHRAGDGGMRACPPAEMPAIPAAELRYSAPSFSAEVPYEACGRDFFDGSDVSFELTVNGTPIAGRFNINPVPYAQFANVAGVANQYGVPDCPAGYERVTDPVAPYAIICRRGEDQVVRVGSGASAFWIDRFEASVWSSRDSGGTPFFLRDNDFPATAFPRNGQWRTPGVTTPPVYASSRYFVAPSRFITWFQASEACAASGKRLPTGEEWLRAAQGTNDPGDVNPDVGGRCRTGGGATEPRHTGVGIGTGIGTGCVSGWGAVDMIGNVWEWTSEWYAGVGAITSPTITIPALPLPDSGVFPGGVALAPTPLNAHVTAVRINSARAVWPADYRDDRIWNVNSVAARGLGDDGTPGHPAAALRGGAWDHGSQAGVFALSLTDGPSSWADRVGFRCVIPR